MTTSHTPGPWRFGKTDKQEENDHTAYVLAPMKLRGDWTHFSPIATIHGTRNDQSTVANARLIAAAPDLLEALRNIENDDGSIPATIWKMRNDAIAKATSPSA